jgi:hypothetical protein
MTTTPVMVTGPEITGGVPEPGIATGGMGPVFPAGLVSSAETADARQNATSDNHPTACDERFMFGAFP